MYAVILAGGSGTRLWPLARAARPKQFLALLGGESLFARTIRRVRPLVPPERILVVAGTAHARWVRGQAPFIPRRNLILEGVGRNTAASVALAAAAIARRDPDALMVVLPADHDIHPAALFRADLRRAIDAVHVGGGLMTLGVPPRSAEAGFGYILTTPRPRGAAIRDARRFIEKPSPRRAARLIRAGGCLWNSGIFVWKAAAIQAALARHRPDIARAVARIKPAPGRDEWRIRRAAMARIPAVSIDQAVLERSAQVRVARARFSWSDLGNWAAVGSLLGEDRDRNRTRGLVLSVGAGDSIAVTDRGVIALVGVRGLAVVRAGDAVLICPRGAAQEVRELVRRLKGPLRVYA